MSRNGFHSGCLQLREHDHLSCDRVDYGIENRFWGGSDVPDDTVACNFEALNISLGVGPSRSCGWNATGRSSFPKDILGFLVLYGHESIIKAYIHLCERSDVKYL